MNDGTTTPSPALRIGLAASRSLVTGPASPVILLLREMAPLLRALGATIVTTPDCADSLRRHGLHQRLTAIEVVPGGRLEQMVWLVAAVVSTDETALDWVIHLSDPDDPSSSYPETTALKRQCVVHGKPYLGTYATAWEWLCLHWLARKDDKTLPAPPVRQDNEAAMDFLRTRTVALVAHDTRKGEMLDFALQHHGLLTLFGRRLATGTTASLLNGRAPSRRLSEGTDELASRAQALAERLSLQEDWIDHVQSGPMGGDAEIAREILRRRCDHVLFFEDPHVPREHEADIQLMERAARLERVECLCLHDPKTAAIWAGLWQTCLSGPAAAAPISLSAAWRQAFGEEVILSDDPAAEAEAAARAGGGAVTAEGDVLYLTLPETDQAGRRIAFASPAIAHARLAHAPGGESR
ncbi:methylglyoxal synthase [Telmatospirillum sp. J64-1]|uniref:methylglyoxal synthase n=1 Tax=Telmatospirillum sp. J64-1 TaxID=2502183 RepID=UPI00115CA524|nr:methylglyoxal synthase [Telmatospirillum sp. J64-1]